MGRNKLSIDPNIGIGVKILRKKRNLTLLNFEQVLGLRENTWWRKEEGQIGYSPTELLDISKLLKCTVDHIHRTGELGYEPEFDAGESSVALRNQNSALFKMHDLDKATIKSMSEKIALLEEMLNGSTGKP